MNKSLKIFTYSVIFSAFNQLHTMQPSNTNNKMALSNTCKQFEYAVRCNKIVESIEEKRLKQDTIYASLSLLNKIEGRKYIANKHPYQIDALQRLVSNPPFTIDLSHISAVVIPEITIINNIRTLLPEFMSHVLSVSTTRPFPLYQNKYLFNMGFVLPKQYSDVATLLAVIIGHKDSTTTDFGNDILLKHGDLLIHEIQSKVNLTDRKARFSLSKILYDENSPYFEHIDPLQKNQIYWGIIYPEFSENYEAMKNASPSEKINFLKRYKEVIKDYLKNGSQDFSFGLETTRAEVLKELCATRSLYNRSTRHKK